MIEFGKSTINHDTGNEIGRPDLCRYVKVKFYGKQFPPELTYNQMGYVLRTGTLVDQM